jgi:hypothetical protein
MHTALSIEKDPTVAGSLRIGDQNWVIGALIVASLINESSANIRRSGATPDSKSESRWVTGLVGGLRARSAVMIACAAEIGEVGDRADRDDLRAAAL